MPKELKDLLGEDLKKRFDEADAPDLLDRIADETIATEADALREYLEKVGHPALQMEDMSVLAETAQHEQPAAAGGPRPSPDTSAPDKQAVAPEGGAKTDQEEDGDMQLTPELIAQIKQEVTDGLVAQLRENITRDVVREIIGTLSSTFLGEERAPAETASAATVTSAPEPEIDETPSFEVVQKGPSAAERIAAIKAFDVPRDACTEPVWTVKLGATAEEGGTRGHTLVVGGASAMPFHLWEGALPHRPLVAMEVFDAVSEKYPAILRDIYGAELTDPAAMAATCVRKYGADLISVRLEGTHPEKGNRSPEQAVEVVKSVLAAVDVPLIVTGHSHFERCNDVMKAVAQACAGENLLLNWVEQDNYRTVAGSAIAYGHSLVAQSPIDVNIAKQLNILLTNMDVKPEQIVMDPMTGAMGYGIEYTYSVMERIRLTGLGGDSMLAGPMIVTPGQECIKVKEFKATEEEFPAWGELGERAALWELATATNLLYAGADILIMYHPQAAMATKKTIFKLMDGTAAPANA
jgi:acetyl-CoA decarbonylase/synthase complex subunit delta